MKTTVKNASTTKTTTAIIPKPAAPMRFSLFIDLSVLFFQQSMYCHPSRPRGSFRLWQGPVCCLKWHRKLLVPPVPQFEPALCHSLECSNIRYPGFRSCFLIGSSLHFATASSG